MSETPGEKFSRTEIEGLATVFPGGPVARAVLLAAGYPPAALPTAAETAYSYWEQIAASVSAGVMGNGRRRILAEARERYPYNPIFAAAYSAATMKSAETLADSAGKETPRQLRVLMLGASPDTRDRVRWDAELKAMRSSADRGGFMLDYCPAADADDLKRVREFQPDLLHLACHGDGDDLVFESGDGEPHAISAADIVATLRLARSHSGVRLRGVLLRSCGSERIADAFTEVAKTVIAHSGQLDDRCAAVFTANFYEELAAAPAPAVADLSAVATRAAQYTVNRDRYCRSVLTGLVIRTTVA